MWDRATRDVAALDPEYCLWSPKCDISGWTPTLPNEHCSFCGWLQTFVMTPYFWCWCEWSSAFLDKPADQVLFKTHTGINRKWVGMKQSCPDLIDCADVDNPAGLSMHHYICHTLVGFRPAALCLNECWDDHAQQTFKPSWWGCSLNEFIVSKQFLWGTIDQTSNWHIHFNTDYYLVFTFWCVVSCSKKVKTRFVCFSATSGTVGNLARKDGWWAVGGGQGCLQ